MKKAICTVINVLSCLLIVAALFVLLSVFLTGDGKVPSVFGYSSFRVCTGSMEPTIQEDDMILVKAVDPAEIAVGDIITFYSPDPTLDRSPITHRVAIIETRNGELYFQTKGDANIIQDEYPVAASDVIGEVIFISPAIGKIVGLASNPLIFVLFIIVPLLLILIVNLTQTVRLARQSVQEEEEQLLAEALEKLKAEKAAAETAEATTPPSEEPPEE